MRAVSSSFSRLLTATVAFAPAGFGLAIVSDYGAVDVDAGAWLLLLVGRCAEGGGARVAFVIIVVSGGIAGYDEHDLAVLLEVFIPAGAVVGVEGSAFVDELDAAVVICFCFASGEPADFAYFEAAFCYVEGIEVEGVGDALVFEDQDVWS